MTKPQPIAEVVVTSQYPKDWLSIVVSSPDADAWVRANAEEFGELFVPERTKHNRDFVLHVDANYKPDEVAAYIRTMGAPEEQADLSAFDTAPTASDGDAADTGE